ncbi:MAG: hypothetical protein ABSF27_06345 [Candidatus Dormibacteria bacterium]|jgi:hypothetical protein
MALESSGWRREEIAGVLRAELLAVVTAVPTSPPGVEAGGGGLVGKVRGCPACHEPRDDPERRRVSA